MALLMNFHSIFVCVQKARLKTTVLWGKYAYCRTALSIGYLEGG